MVTFTRIELRDAPPQADEKLREALTVAGFSTTVLGKNGVRYELPSGTYCCKSSRSISHVLNAARDIARSLGYESSAITIPSQGAHWVLGEAVTTDPTADTSFSKVTPNDADCVDG